MVLNVFRPAPKKSKPLARSRFPACVYHGPLQGRYVYRSRLARRFWEWGKRGTRWPSIFSN